MTTSILSGSARRVLSGNAIRALLRTEMIRYSNVLTKGPLFLYPDADVVESWRRPSFWSNEPATPSTPRKETHCCGVPRR